MQSIHQRIVIKIGSNVLTNKQGLPHLTLIQHLVSEIAKLIKEGKEVVLVSSGAVAAGRSFFTPKTKLDTISQRQVLASLGQVKLLSVYGDFFLQQGLYCSQVLVTKEDFRDRTHYLNIRNCFDGLLQNGVIPIVNENDVVSVTELMFTDNDELAGLVAGMLDVDALFVLSNVDGVYDAPPSDPSAKVIPIIEKDMLDFSSFISTEKSNFGRGGMLTKCHNAQKVAELGIHVHIANGTQDNIISHLCEPKPKFGTWFKAQKKKSSVKKWVAHSEESAKGSIVINQGAKSALLSDTATSLLPIGIVKMQGEFRKGEIVKICDEGQNPIGLGIAKYGKKELEEAMGKKNQKLFIHYDYLFLF